MIKSSVLIKRKEGMSVEEFQDYWRVKHAPLAAKLPGLLRYILCPTIPSEYERDQQPDFDGVSEMSFEDLGALERAKASREYETVAADLANFVGESTELIETEVELIGAYSNPEDRRSMVKYIAMLFLKDGVPIQEFQRHWKDVHGPINVGNSKIMKRYVQSHVLPELFEGPNPPRYGGLPEAWYESLDIYRNTPRDPNAVRDTNWPNVCSGQNSIMTKEVVIV